jgi:hypothetical protein
VFLTGAVPVGADETIPAVFVTHDTGYPAGEPTLGVLPSGAIIFQASTKTLKSTDEGATWTVAHQPPTGTLTLDPYVHVDPVTGLIAASQLFGACQEVSLSRDEGATWTDAPTQCLTVDHQKIGTGPWAASPVPHLYERAVYTCVNHVSDTACAVSPDGGLTWGPLVTVFPGVDPTAPEGLFTPGFCGGLEGDPVSGPDGTIYLPREYCGRPFVGVSHDNGLTWATHHVAPPAQTRPIGFGANNPAVTVADDATVFYAWTGDDWRHHVARSTDQGVTWTDLGIVSSPEVLSTTFPLVLAGKPGMVATAYVGTPNSSAGPDEAPASARWYLYVAYSLNANDAAPVWTTVSVTPTDPVMIGCIGRHGGSCGNGNLLDFNGIAFTRDGRIAISYTDACLLPACKSSATSNNDRGVLAIETSGPLFK